MARYHTKTWKTFVGSFPYGEITFHTISFLIDTIIQNILYTNIRRFARDSGEYVGSLYEATYFNRPGYRSREFYNSREDNPTCCSYRSYYPQWYKLCHAFPGNRRFINGLKTVAFFLPSAGFSAFFGISQIVAILIAPGIRPAEHR